MPRRRHENTATGASQARRSVPLDVEIEHICGAGARREKESERCGGMNEVSERRQVQQRVRACVRVCARV